MFSYCIASLFDIQCWKAIKQKIKIIKRLTTPAYLSENKRVLSAHFFLNPEQVQAIRQVQPPRGHGAGHELSVRPSRPEPLLRPFLPRRARGREEGGHARLAPGRSFETALARRLRGVGEVEGSAEPQDDFGQGPDGQEPRQPFLSEQG